MGRKVGGAEQDEGAQRLATLADGVASSLRQSVDEAVEDLGFEVVVADDGAAVGAGDVRGRRQLPEQVLELGLAFGAGSAKAVEDAAAHGLPEARGVEQFDDEEVAAGGLDAFADLSEEVGLAGPGGPANDDAERRRDGVAGGVAEGLHDVVGGVLVETLDVSLRLRPPEIVGGRSPEEAQRRERFPLASSIKARSR